MNRSCRRLWLGFVFAILMIAQSRALASPSPIAMPSDLDQVDFYLHTVDVGTLVFDNFGHTALRVHDLRSGRDMIFNWGMFDFGEPLGFSVKFFQGILNYKLAIYPLAVAERIYASEGRAVWEDKLNLTREQKATLMRRLIWHAEPENVTYAYQYFFDNCSTRPRDFIDEALEGRVHQLYETKMTGERFRDMVRSHYATIPFIAVSLDILMNHDIDREMSVWQKMFLPRTLREALRELPSDVSVDGRPMPLLEEVTKLVDSPTPEPPPIDGWQFFMLLFGAPLVATAGILIARARSRAEAPRWIMRVFGLLVLLYGFYTGVIGLLMPMSWALSEHTDLHHNANMWFFWPSDLVLCLLGFGWLILGRPFRVDRTLGRVGASYCGAHVLFTVFAGLAWLTGLIEQDIGRVFGYFGPIAIVLWTAVYLGGLVRTSAGRENSSI